MKLACSWLLTPSLRLFLFNQQTALPLGRGAPPFHQHNPNHSQFLSANSFHSLTPLHCSFFVGLVDSIHFLYWFIHQSFIPFIIDFFTPAARLLFINSKAEGKGRKAKAIQELLERRWPAAEERQLITHQFIPFHWRAIHFCSIPIPPIKSKVSFELMWNGSSSPNQSHQSTNTSIKLF